MGEEQGPGFQSYTIDTVGLPAPFIKALSDLAEPAAISPIVKAFIVKRSEVLETLARHKAALAERYRVNSLALFGSTSRDSASATSDLDILVSFDGPATSDRYFGVQFYLEDLFGCRIDLVTSRALRPEMRSTVERDAIYV